MRGSSCRCRLGRSAAGCGTGPGAGADGQDLLSVELAGVGEVDGRTRGLVLATWRLQVVPFRRVAELAGASRRRRS